MALEEYTNMLFKTATRSWQFIYIYKVKAEENKILVCKKKYQFKKSVYIF